MAAPVVDPGTDRGWLAPDALAALAVLLVLVLAAAGVGLAVLAGSMALAVLAGGTWALRRRRGRAPWWITLTGQRAALAQLRRRHEALAADPAAPSADVAELGVALDHLERAVAGVRARARSLDRAALARALARRPMPTVAEGAVLAEQAGLSVELARTAAQLDRCAAERAAALDAARLELDLIDQVHLGRPA